MSSSLKKVIVRKLDRDWLAGYLPAVYFAREGKIELLDLAGKVLTLPLDEVKWLCFVRDFNSGETGNPERLLRKTYAGRPRGEGLWLRLRLTDNDQIEGLVTNDVTLIDPQGLLLTPPDIRSNTQRVFVPQSSITALEVVAVIGTSTRATPQKPIRPTQQEGLFREPE